MKVPSDWKALPTPVGGVSGITRLYVTKFGNLPAGSRVLIQTRQQANGWRDAFPAQTTADVPGKPHIPCTSVLLPPWFQDLSGISTEPRPGFDSICLAAIQRESHFHAASTLSGSFVSLSALRLRTLDFPPAHASIRTAKTRATSPAGLSHRTALYFRSTNLVT